MLPTNPSNNQVRQMFTTTVNKDGTIDIQSKSVKAVQTITTIINGKTKKTTVATEITSKPLTQLKTVTFHKREPSTKCSCPAKLFICCWTHNSLHEVEWHWKHKGHNPFSLDNMKHMKASGPLKNWLSEKVLGGMTWPTSCKLLCNSDLTRVSCNLYFKPDTSRHPTTHTGTSWQLQQVPEAFKADYQLVKNIMKKVSDKNQQLDSNVVNSLQRWVEKLQAMGWHVLSHIHQKPESRVIIAFLPPWQKEQIRLHGNDLLGIDSTHNTTKIIPQFGSRKLLTFLLLLRQPDTGRGLPVAWLLTTDESTQVKDLSNLSNSTNKNIQLYNQNHPTVAPIKPQHSTESIYERLQQSHRQNVRQQHFTTKTLLVRRTFHQGRKKKGWGVCKPHTLDFQS